MRNKRLLLVLAVLVVLMMVLSGCMPGNTDFQEKPAGFFAGLWHGFLIVLTFIISIFTNKVTIYEVNNVGFWYNLGYVIGASAALGGGGYGSRGSRND